MHALDHHSQISAFLPSPSCSLYQDFQSLLWRQITTEGRDCPGRNLAADDSWDFKLSNIHITNQSSTNLPSPLMKSQTMMLIIKRIFFRVWPQMLPIWLWHVLASIFVLIRNRWGNDRVSRAAAVQKQTHYHVFQQWASAAALHLQTAFSLQLHHSLCVTRSDEEAAKVFLFWLIYFYRRPLSLYPSVVFLLNDKSGSIRATYVKWYISSVAH